MDERHANIDLAFRNGLKDYEVLPPPDVWNCIESRIVRKNKPAYLMRAAAFLAIAMTMSVLAYRWIGKTSTPPDNTILALNEESSSPFKSDNFSKPIKRKALQFEQPMQFVESISGNSPVISQRQPVVDNEVASILNLPETHLWSPGKSSSLNIIHNQSDLTTSPKINLTAENVSNEYQDYLADNSEISTGTRWSIAALVTPTYYGKFNSGSDAVTKQIVASDQPAVSYTGGVTFSYKVNKRFSVQSGLFYSSVGQEINGINSFAGFQKYDNTKGDHNFEILTSNGTVTTNNSDVFLFAVNNNNRLITAFTKDVFDPKKASLNFISNTMKQSFSYLELPVFMRYKLIDKKVDFNILGGFSYNILLDNSVYTIIDGSKYMIGTTDGINKYSISSSVGMGMEYNFSDKLSLNLEPTFRYYLNSFNNEYGSDFHHYSFGVFSGITYKF